MASGGRKDNKKNESDSGLKTAGIVLGATAATAIGVGLLSWGMKKLFSEEREPETSHSSDYAWDESKLRESAVGDYSGSAMSTGLLKTVENSPQDEGITFQPDESKPLADNLEKYFKEVVTINEDDRRSAKEVVEKIKNAARKFFKDNFPSKPLGDFQHKGSSYEGLKVISPNEYDITMPLKMKSHLWEIVEPDHVQNLDGFRMVKRINLKQFPLGSSPWDEYLTANEILSPAKVYQQFQSYLDKFLLRCSDVLIYTIRRSKTGPAITLNVSYGEQKLDIDLVPEVEINHIPLVAKQHPMVKREGGEQYAHLWARSYSLKEKELFKTIDVGDGCRRKCLKIIKAIFYYNRSQFKILSSYHVKTIIMGMSEDEDWRQRCLAERFIDVIISLRDHLDDGDLPHHFDPSVNLLKYIKQDAKYNVKCFLNKVINRGNYIELLKSNL
ncbi:unnamed protein product [Owenia fusiformis]|uniref:Uncharacterized protein n=1 Tax=Owenia fusiformis TaxID=6347 RepID=A0A8J1U6Q9_OWEFU|nr:unnamed protein product [Owenia fusiformis]